MNLFQQPEKLRARLVNILFASILAMGAALRCYQYLMGRSLWEDEAHLAVNFLTRGYGALLRPLDYLQLSPPLFLWAVKTCTLIGGHGPLALRAFPFITSLLTLPLFYYIVRDLTGSRTAALTGFFAFAANLELIYYASELKPYGVDVAVWLLLVYLAVARQPFVGRHRNRLLAVAGCIGMLCSNVAFLALCCIACSFLLTALRQKQLAPARPKLLAVWAIFFVAQYFLFLYHHPYTAQSHDNYTFAFPPRPLFGAGFNAFIVRAGHEVGFMLLLHLSRSMGFPWLVLPLFALAVGCALYRRQWPLLLLTVLPVLLHFTLSALQLYPFWYRFILYLIPPLLLLLAYSVSVIAGLLRRLHPAAGVLFALAGCYFFTEDSFHRFPLYYREIGPVLRYINIRYPGAPVYVTTPYTLYKYYAMTGVAKDTLFEGLTWNASPAQYQEAVAGAGRNYLLLHAADTAVDGYGAVLADLKRRQLIVRELSYKTYTVSEVRVQGDGSHAQLLDYRWFDPAAAFDLNGQKVAAIWAGQVSTRPLLLPKGHYRISVIAKGTPAGGVYPHLSVALNGALQASFFTHADDSTATFPFSQQSEGPVTIRIALDNDSTDARTGEDRNAFIHRIAIEKTGE